MELDGNKIVKDLPLNKNVDLTLVIESPRVVALNPWMTFSWSRFLVRDTCSSRLMCRLKPRPATSAGNSVLDAAHVSSPSLRVTGNVTRNRGCDERSPCADRTATVVVAR